MSKRTQIVAIRKLDTVNKISIPVEWLNKLGIEKCSEMEISIRNSEIVLRRYSQKEKLERDFEDLVCKYGLLNVKEMCENFKL